MAETHGFLTRLVLRTRAGRYTLLGVLVADVFVIPPLVSIGVLPRWAQAVAFSATMAAALVALAPHRAARGLAMAIAAVALVARWTPLATDLAAFDVLQASTAGIAAATFAGMLLLDVFSKGRLPDRLLAVLLVYLLIGVTWANAYVVADLLHPGALSMPGPEHPMSEFVYFSFATLTSVGYGDVLPVHPIVRSLAVVEALTGQLYLVTVVARFVGESASGRAPGDA
jgi:hypothetical protein